MRWRRMSATVSLKNIEGLDLQLADVLKAIDGNLEATADYVEAEAKTTAAFKDLTKTRSRIKKQKSKFADGGWIVVARAPHAHLVEYGHVMIAWGRPNSRQARPASSLPPPCARKGHQLRRGKFKEAQG